MRRFLDKCRLGPWWRTAVIVSFALATAHADPLEQQIDQHLQRLRAVHVVSDEKLLDQYNREMDAGWRLFSADKIHSLPILRARLQAEAAAPHPSALVLLDTGFYVYSNDQAEGKVIARTALGRVDFRDPVVTANEKELFDFMHVVAMDHDPAVLPMIDRAFLRSNDSIFIPQHALKLDGTLICTFLFGAYGPESENFLRQKLADKAVSQRVLEILIWIGSPASFPEISRTLTESPKYETFARVMTYMMQVAGPAGRSYMLSLDPSKFDARSQEYLAKVHKDIQNTSFETFKVGLTRYPCEKSLPDQVVLQRLDLMIKNLGVDDKTSPLAVLNSGIPSQILIDKLTAICSRALFRVSDEALDDVEATNLLLVGLRYRVP